jgi:hypothetical protein
MNYLDSFLNIILHDVNQFCVYAALKKTPWPDSASELH